jgi:hypothetical protein
MDIERETQDKIYNYKYSNWRNKWYPKIKLWHFIFLYKKGNIDNKNIIIFIPFLNWIISFLFILISSVICGKYDFDYIEKYYPDIFKKIWIMGRDNGIINRIAFNELYNIEYGKDSIIDEIIKYQKNFIPMLIIPFIIAVINAIAVEFIR